MQGNENNKVEYLSLNDPAQVVDKPKLDLFGACINTIFAGIKKISKWDRRCLKY